jgi:hypothetical protein
MGRSLLKMSNEEIYGSSLRFIFKQLDLYVENNKQDNKNNKKGSKNTKSEETKKLKVLD